MRAASDGCPFSHLRTQVGTVLALNASAQVGTVLALRKKDLLTYT